MNCITNEHTKLATGISINRWSVTLSIEAGFRASRQNNTSTPGREKPQLKCFSCNTWSYNFSGSWSTGVDTTHRCHNIKVVRYTIEFVSLGWACTRLTTVVVSIAFLPWHGLIGNSCWTSRLSRGATVDPWKVRTSGLNQPSRGNKMTEFALSAKPSFFMDSNINH